MADEPLLDLSTLIVRPFIMVDGRRYDIFSADELSVLASHRFGVWGRRLELLDQSDQETDGEEISDLIAKIARAAIVDMPDAVFVTLPGAQLRAIVDVFTGLLLRAKLGVVGAMARASGVPIGEKPFPGSSAFSAGTPDGGWWKRLRRWFGRI